MAAPLTRELVIDAARAAIERDGVDRLSFRGVARDLGVTAPALYAHVGGKEELLAAVATAHFEGLARRFEAVDEADPLDRIRALCHAYVEHALEAPGLFRLLFRYPPAPAGGVDAFGPATRTFDAAAAATAEAIARGQLAVDDVGLASMTMWAAVHGVAEVLLLGFPPDGLTAHELVDTVIETVLAGQAHPRARRSS